MAKKKEIKTVLERTYNIPLRSEWLKVSRYKRAKKAAKAVREFLMKHMKSENVKIGKHLNLKLWEHGIKNPPHHIKVNAVKYDDGLVKTELFGFKIEEEKKEIKEKAKKAEEEVKKELGLGEKKEEAKEEKEKRPGEKAEEKKEEESKEEPGEAKEKKPAEEKKEEAPKKLGKRALKKELEKKENKD